MPVHPRILGASTFFAAGSVSGPSRRAAGARRGRRQVVLTTCSGSYTLLTLVAEAARALLFPFDYEHPYHPVLPKSAGQPLHLCERQL